MRFASITKQTQTDPRIADHAIYCLTVNANVVINDYLLLLDLDIIEIRCCATAVILY